MLEKDITNEWKVSEERPGYVTRTTKRGNVTVHVYRPILTPEAQAEREQAIKDAAAKMMGSVMRAGEWKENFKGGKLK